MLEKMGEFFDARLSGYEEHQLTCIDSAKEFYPYTASCLPQIAGTRLLDLGCGTGLELGYYFELVPSAEVTGIDLAPGMLEALRNKFPDKNMTLILGSYFDVPFGENSFDAAVSVESLHHFTGEEKIRLYEKLLKALKPGGSFILTDYFAKSDEEECFRRAELFRLKKEQNIEDDTFYHYDTPLTVEHEIEGGKSMKVLLINGSPHKNGCTATALAEMIKIFEKEGIETKLIQIGNQNIRGCVSCGYCAKNGKCVVRDDAVNEVAPLFEEADGLVIGSPVYYGSPNGTVLSFLDRLFYSTSFSKQMKVGASVVSCRRGGNTASFDVLNKYFTISGMPVASSTYWNQVHGHDAESVKKDEEGLQTMRNLARNMAFLMRAIKTEKETNGLPEVERGAFTSFADGK